MSKLFAALLFNVIMLSNLYAAQSTIVEYEGYACMGEDKLMKQTENAYAISLSISSYGRESQPPTYWAPFVLHGEG